MPDLSLADIKGRLSALGAQLEPNAQLVTVERPLPGVRASVVSLERVADVVGDPGYCVHGFASCTRCEELCYLGDQTLEAVLTPDTFPLCLQCVQEVVPDEARVSAQRLHDHPAES